MDNERLLPSKTHDNGDQALLTHIKHQQSFSKRWLTVPSYNVSLAFLNCLLLVSLVTGIFRSVGNDAPLSPSPAREIIEYRPTIFDKYGHLNGNPFSQPPGPELDNAWHTLLAGMNIRISFDWLDQLEVETLHLADGSGGVVQLGVYHELHCLKKLKHWNYRDHYHGNLSTADFAKEESHVEHCLEWLRIAALCHSDITLTTLRWGDHGNLETEYPVPRKCVKAEKVLDWSRARAVDLYSEGVV